MKNLLFAFLSLSILFISCEKDDPADLNTAELQHDGDNNTAPLFDPGTYSTAVRFAAGITNEFIGKNLTEIEFYMANVPTTCILKVFAEGTQAQPGWELYSADITSSIRPGEWNTHQLSTAIPIRGDDIWFALEITQNQRLQTVGCDFGPAVSGGDWVFTETDNAWLTFRVLTGTESINWNIRGQIE